MVEDDDLNRRHGGAATTLLKGISLATVSKVLAPTGCLRSFPSGYSSNSDQNG
jgi:hypothetical protein